MYKNLYNKIYKMLLIRREINKVRREQQEESRGMNYHVSAKDFKHKEIYDLGEKFRGTDPRGEEIGFTNYYMTLNGKPFFGISGEFHFSRCEAQRWEDELLKMKMCGINVITTYIFWNHHEEEEGTFDFEGRRNLRHFVELCKKHGLYVIVRIGPFDHGEARNGGLPDWLYGKPFEVRKLSEGFLFYVRRLYGKISEQLKGLLYKDGGPVIGAQIDNEYMHSSAPWELTTGISNEWVFGGDEGETYMLTLLDEAKKCGIQTPFYTCTGWGGAVTPSVMMPLWGGYAYRPWLFYTRRGEHPCTEEYIYQDYHNSQAVVTSDFHPAYDPETRPYACCEMGGGMMCSYNYRFILPYKSVDAMANIKIASGCNFLGYYVFQGGTNPLGKHGGFLNESQVPKMSYDYQAALGEFGQIRESYLRLKTMHLFCRTFGEELCKMETVLPEGESLISPEDLDTLRFSVRTDGEKGFLFLNNFQDHAQPRPKKNETVTIELKDTQVIFDHIDLEGEENCILPFGWNMDGILLQKAGAQMITRIEKEGQITYVFLKPEGMTPVFTFEEEAITSQGNHVYKCGKDKPWELFIVEKGDICLKILCLDRNTSNQMYLLRDQTLLFARGAVMEEEDRIRLETESAYNKVMSYPKGAMKARGSLEKAGEEDEIFDCWTLRTEEKKPQAEIAHTAALKYTVKVPEDFMEGLKDVLLQIRYKGDIGYAFINGEMVHDNFWNGDLWEIGLRTLAEKLKKDPLTISITPLKEGANVNVESAMAARMENVKAYTGELESVELKPVYEFSF